MTASRVSHLSDPRQIGAGINKALRKTDAIDLSSDQATVTIDRDVDISGVIKVSGTQVVAAQQAAIADDGSGASNQAKVNAILAALRAHGLIAT